MEPRDTHLKSMVKGIFDFEIGGKKRGFKFGTYAMAIACRAENCKVGELLKKIGLTTEVKEGEERSGNIDLMALLNFYHAAAVAHAEHNKQPVDFTVQDVSDWLDELGEEKMAKITTEGLTQYEPKNERAPETPGATTSQ